MAITLTKPTSDYSISQLLAIYNDECRVRGLPGRQSFRTKEVAVKAVDGLILQYQDEPADEQLAVPPGRARLQASPLAEQLRQSVLADQTEATGVVNEERRTTLSVNTGNHGFAPPPRDTSVENPPIKKRGRVSTLAGTTKITVLAKTNPKREGSASHDRFAKYRTGMTIDEYGAAIRSHGKALRDIQWDVKYGYIHLDE